MTHPKAHKINSSGSRYIKEMQFFIAKSKCMFGIGAVVNKQYQGKAIGVSCHLKKLHVGCDNHGKVVSLIQHEWSLRSLIIFSREVDNKVLDTVLR